LKRISHILLNLKKFKQIIIFSNIFRNLLNNVNIYKINFDEKNIKTQINKFFFQIINAKQEKNMEFFYLILLNLSKILKKTKIYFANHNSMLFLNKKNKFFFFV